MIELAIKSLKMSEKLVKIRQLMTEHGIAGK